MVLDISRSLGCPEASWAYPAHPARAATTTSASKPA